MLLITLQMGGGVVAGPIPDGQPWLPLSLYCQFIDSSSWIPYRGCRLLFYTQRGLAVPGPPEPTGDSTDPYSRSVSGEFITLGPDFPSLRPRLQGPHDTFTYVYNFVVYIGRFLSLIKFLLGKKICLYKTGGLIFFKFCF